MSWMLSRMSVYVSPSSMRDRLVSKRGTCAHATLPNYSAIADAVGTAAQDNPRGWYDCQSFNKAW